MEDIIAKESGPRAGEGEMEREVLDSSSALGNEEG